MTGVRYRDVITTPVIIPLAQPAGPNFIVMDNYTSRHGAKVLSDDLQDNDITHMDLPARSPHLILIEHVSDILGRRVCCHHCSVPNLSRLYR